MAITIIRTSMYAAAVLYWLVSNSENNREVARLHLGETRNTTMLTAVMDRRKE